ncbi:helix-turn-helix domain-containing protein [Aminobacter sp. BE322]|uniref:helix-turn-helix domain-containing protein n=1 Tax=unclassified Aminobacter TaxID=2644704 RepID=UPI003D25B3EE
MTSQKRSRPDARTSGPADHQNEQVKAYGQVAGKASGQQDDGFTVFKWEWLDQVATDPAQPPAAIRVAVVVAGRYLNRKTGSAWPSIETLASDLSIKSLNTVRAALKALEIGGHMAVNWSAGGPKKTHKFIPLVNGIPFKNLKGMECGNPSKLRSASLQNPDQQPCKKLKGNPLMEPFDEPRQTPQASANGDTTNHSRDAHPAGASPDPVMFELGHGIDVDGFGQCSITGKGIMTKTIAGEERTFGIVRMISCREIDLLCGAAVINGREALLPNSTKRYDEVSPEQLKRIRWNAPSSQSSKGARDEAA